MKKKKKNKKRIAEQSVEELERQTLSNKSVSAGKKSENSEFDSEAEPKDSKEEIKESSNGDDKKKKKRGKPAVDIDEDMIENPAGIDIAVLEAEESEDLDEVDDLQLAEEGRALLVAIDKK